MIQGVLLVLLSNNKSKHMLLWIFVYPFLIHQEKRKLCKISMHMLCYVKSTYHSENVTASSFHFYFY